MKLRYYYVYILTNTERGVLYIGVTNNLIRRIIEHKSGTFDGFTKKYNLKKLVYFQQTEDVQSALSREKQLKGWHRDWKINLIESCNKKWEDLFSQIMGDPETSSG
jgi:putative endonuclease